ncbi:MAG: hypothetical protein HW396_1799, partial [Candidatus Dadabacteria bacterium]|nr:hypothetical protein [Candidatus Dadabacteria bacterium]
MKKLIMVQIFLTAFLFSTVSKADTNLFLSLGLGVGIPAPVFVAPSPVIYYAYPTFASVSLVSVSPNVFLSFGIGIPAPVFIAPTPVILAPPVFAFPSAVIVGPAPVVVYPAPVIIHSGPQHINVHKNVHIHSHGGSSKFKESIKVKHNKVKYKAVHKVKHK